MVGGLAGGEEGGELGEELGCVVLAWGMGAQ